MGIDISVGGLAFIYLIIIFLTPIKFDMNIFIIICIFCIMFGIIRAIAAFAPDKPKLCDECKERLE